MCLAQLAAGSLSENRFSEKKLSNFAGSGGKQLARVCLGLLVGFHSVSVRIACAMPAELLVAVVSLQVSQISAFKVPRPHLPSRRGTKKWASDGAESDARARSLEVFQDHRQRPSPRVFGLC